MRLSDRLTAVYQNLLPDQDVWDVCCDHGYLGVAAYRSEKFPNIYFVDQVSTIIERLQVRFNKYVFRAEAKSLAHFICADAKENKIVVNGTLCITGVGGMTIFEILENLATNQLLNANRLILGPHRDELKLNELIKTSFQLNRYEFHSKVDVIENGRARSIYIFQHNRMLN